MEISTEKKMCLQKIFGSQVSFDTSLAPFTTYKVGGNASIFFTPNTVDELKHFITWSKDESLPFFIIGRGSNVLVSDRGFAGVAIQLQSAFNSIQISEEEVTVGGATTLPVVARKTVAAGLEGFAWAVGVPGSFGGAVKMNAGGHGSEIAENLLSVDVLDLRDGEITRLSGIDLHFGYRKSSLHPYQMVLSGVLRLHVAQDQKLQEKLLSDIVSWRREHQPGGTNAGSVFANPENDSAGRLIEVAGLKGFRIGSAKISDKHANFIQTDTGGSANDVLLVMKTAHRKIKDMFGIDLHVETRLIGFTIDEQEELVST